MLWGFWLKSYVLVGVGKRRVSMTRTSAVRSMVSRAGTPCAPNDVIYLVGNGGRLRGGVDGCGVGAGGNSVIVRLSRSSRTGPLISI